MNSEEMSKEELENFKERAEKEFFDMLERGEDIRVFLYFPYNMLSDNIKKHLDEFLLLEAYKCLEKDMTVFEKDFVVYEDTMIRISLNEEKKRIELLERMLKYFIEKEAYENCSKVQTIMKKLQNG